PALVIGAIGLYVLFRAPVAAMILQAIGGANRAIAEVTMGQGGQALNTNVGFPIHEILAGVVFFIGLAYAIKTLEALIFQAKI
ncbi:MAG: hypothetical protein MH204_11925, partial [Fimbriimonadaceae bacterium]|nr:hypothetical protein [Fimbriimonadaceae bacterium]